MNFPEAFKCLSNAFCGTLPSCLCKVGCKWDVSAALVLFLKILSRPCITGFSALGKMNLRVTFCGHRKSDFQNIPCDQFHKQALG